MYIHTHTFVYINIVEAELDQRSANERGQQEQCLFVVCAGTADGRAAFISSASQSQDWVVHRKL